MTSNNIVVFPKTKINSNIKNQSIEEIEDNMELIRQIHIQKTIETVAPILFDQLAIAGFEPAEDDSDIKDGAMVVESIRSLLSKNYGIFHPLQPISSSVFQESEEGFLEIPENLFVTITHDKKE
jgi:hypothetical protein